MTTELISYLTKEKFLNLAIESVTETYELYNYDVRFYGSINDDFAIGLNNLKLPETFELRVALYEDGTLGMVNGNCTFFDPVAYHELVVYLEIGQLERNTLVAMVKETLAKFDTAKLSLEVDTSSISDDDIKENFTGVCVELVNVKMTLDSGKRRNFF